MTNDLKKKCYKQGEGFKQNLEGKVHNIEEQSEESKIRNVHGEDLEDCPWTVPLLMLP